MIALKRIKSFLLALTVSCLIFSVVYLGDYYHTDETAAEAFSFSGEIKEERLSDGTIIIKGHNATAGFIFYPGGKVEYTSYIPLMKACAEKGMLCILLKMPLNLAVFDVYAGKGFTELYPEVEKWFIGGHSLGGSMAASCLESDTSSFDGLILLASYSTEDFSETDLKVLSVYGSEDKVLNFEKYEKYKENLPFDFTETVIEGGCHAYFGTYGNQEGDGTPDITNKKQIEFTAEAVSAFVK